MQRRIWFRAFLVVVVTMGAIWLYLSRATPTATVTFIPTPTNAQLGQEISVPLVVTVPVAINAGEFNFTFPSDKLEVKEIRKDASFFELWIKDSPQFNNDRGTINIAGGLPTPGFSGQGTIATVIFQAKSSGKAIISLDQQATRLLLNDGQGGAVESRFRTTGVTIR